METIMNIMNDFEEVEKVLRRLKNTELSLDFQRYRSVLLDLEKNFEIMKSEFTSTIQVLLPKLRQNKADATELTDLILKYNTSPYEKETFLALLATRQKEIETAEFILYNDILRGNKVCTSHITKQNCGIFHSDFEPKL